MTEFATEVPSGLRDATLVAIGELLYIAASPDMADGLSDKEFQILEKSGPDFWRLYEFGTRAGLPKLPDGFGNHFRDDVLTGLRVIRGDKELANQYRHVMRDLLSDEKRVSDLYRNGGETFSDIIASVSKGERSNMPHVEGFVRNPRAGRNRRLQ